MTRQAELERPEIDPERQGKIKGCGTSVRARQCLHMGLYGTLLIVPRAGEVRNLWILSQFDVPSPI